MPPVVLDGSKLPNGRKARDHSRIHGSVSDALLELKAGPSEANRNHLYTSVFGLKEPGPWESKNSWNLGVGTIQEYSQALAVGWPEGLSTMEKHFRGLVDRAELPKNKSIRKRFAWGSDGNEIDISRVYNGQLDRAWETTRNDAGLVRKRHLRMIVECSLSAAHSADRFLWKGAVATLLTDAYESAGFRVEVLLECRLNGIGDGSKGSSYDRTHSHAIVGKAYDEPVNMSVLAMLTGHPATLRTMMFGLMLQDDVRVIDSLGYADHGPSELLELGDIGVYGISSERDATTFLTTELDKLSSTLRTGNIH